MLTILDMFSGLGGIQRRNVIEGMGHVYKTLDIDPTFEPDILADVMDIEPGELGCFDMIWASPPCETWSVTRIGKNWNKDNTPKTEAAARGIGLVKHTLKLLNSSAKYAWFLENPRGKLRKMTFMQDYRRFTVTYCQYGETRMKPTDIWVVGSNWIPRSACKNGDPCHVRAPRGSRTGTQGFGTYAEKSVVPLELWLEIIRAVEEDVSVLEEVC